MDEYQDAIPSEEEQPETSEGFDTPGLAAPSAEFIQRVLSPDFTRVHLTGMYRDWFLDYASYVILERAVPHLDDGLKPVQRRILHTMKRMDDGRYNKVANIIGSTMQFHPHGDASIGEALVQLGQKELLIDTQGNWGNILTGDSASAPRYIEARLSKFALEVVYNSKTTEWMKSYDGRNLEPVTLPVKFPLLLAQGAEGIAVGLSSKILPHNFNELLDASIAYLKGEPFALYPDFPTGGLIDCSRYNDGERGGLVKIRAKIEKQDKSTLVIRELPYSKTTGQLIESIRKANDSGKIRIKKIEDNTAAEAEILVHLQPDTPPDKAIDALYAFTACEVSVWPNACVVYDEKPQFATVSAILRWSAERTKWLLEQELKINLQELEQQWHLASLERIFIENRLYLNIEDCETWESVLSTVDTSLDPWKPLLHRPVTQDDIVHLTEIKIKRISRYDAKKADNLIKSIEHDMEEVKRNLGRMVDFTIEYFQHIKQSYGQQRGRRTQLTSFEAIEATRVVAATQKLYLDAEGGFLGTDSKIGPNVCDCSDIDDVLVILKSGRYMIVPVQEKRFVGKEIVHAAIYNRHDPRTIYNLVYLDGSTKISYVKRCSIQSLIREKEYDLTQGSAGSKLLYLSVNANGEAETIEVRVSDRNLLRQPIFTYDFAQLPIRSRTSKGNQLSKHHVKSVKLKSAGASTLAAVKIWYDGQVGRFNTEERGQLLGEFGGDDLVLVIFPNGSYQTMRPDPLVRIDPAPVRIEKYVPNRIYAIAFYDGEKKFSYLKRCALEVTESPQSLIGEDASSKLLAISSSASARLQLRFAGRYRMKPTEEIDVESFIGVKSSRARGKRLSTLPVESVSFLTPSPVADPEGTDEGGEP